jgi:hypothetical protein
VALVDGSDRRYHGEWMTTRILFAVYFRIAIPEVFPLWETVSICVSISP